MKKGIEGKRLFLLPATGTQTVPTPSISQMQKIFYFLLFFPSVLFAQINESDTLNFKASLSLTGFYQAGNVKTQIFRGRTDISFRPWKNGVYKTTNSYVYQAFGGSKADEDILSLNFLYFNTERKVYPLVLAFVSTNFRREIELRYLLGAGATFQVMERENSYLKFSLTIEYEETDFKRASFNQSDYNGNQSINAIRSTIWVNGRHYMFDGKMILNHESYFQPALADSNNYRWQTDVGFEFPVWEFLSFKINYLQTHESVVIEGQQQEDQFLTFGFTIKNF